MPLVDTGEAFGTPAWEYSPAFQGVWFARIDGAPNRPQVWFEPSDDDVDVAIYVGGAGYVGGGCAAHQASVTTIEPGAEPSLVRALAEVEDASRDLNVRDLLECRFFGLCGRLGEQEGC
ncbi:hypothetical protein JOF56_007925 [Kibdelosporangium banguiense]|uniref:Uncharacterized protein n=1 Tax=Kibdelosporangium banguiense TaxID=1365924 RepID=A0ABS4TT08_9PSEU|nr:hypothetical protein [Kibdelosporangium banguiense]MBP2327540.1 hypothetical protein [Kibdelosporangium banguiense]